MSSIVLATQNFGKVSELRSLLDGSEVRILGLADFNDSFPEPEETGTTFLENATIKAIAYATLTGRVCLADDSGLMIDALDGRPGVISSHYAFEGQAQGRAAELTREQRDQLNIDRVLSELTGFDPVERSARFVCTMVLADPMGNLLATSHGSFEGRIGLPADHPHGSPGDRVPRGSNGFGYDPIFLVAPEYKVTSAQLPPMEKNKLSHRGHAVREMIDQIKELAL